MNKRIAERIFKKIAEGNALHYFNQDSMVLDTNVIFEDEEKEPYLWEPVLSGNDIEVLAKHANELIDEEMETYHKLAAYESAIELAIRSFANGKYDGKVNACNYRLILEKMYSEYKKDAGGTMKRTARYYTEQLDKVADEIRKLVKAGEIAPKEGYSLELAIDSVSEDLENRFASRLEGDADEPYMDEAYNDGSKEHDADEGYIDGTHPSGFANSGQNSTSEEFPTGSEHKLGDPEKKARLAASRLAQKRKARK